MKKLLLLFLLPLMGLAQETPEVFGHRIFKACVANDRTAFETAIVPKADFIAYFKQMNAAAGDDTIGFGHTKYTANASKGFDFWQLSIAELGLDLKTIAIERTETEDRPIEGKVNGQPLTLNTKIINIFFTCSGKKLAFRISDALLINGKWYLGNDKVQIHWLD